MGLFGKKQEIDEEEQDELLELENRKLTKKLKDINSENRKKRKEPPKPWGKKERLLVLTVLAATLILSGILALSAQGFKLPKLSNISFDFQMPSMEKIFGEETIVIENK